jgi:hypothetical protein
MSSQVADIQNVEKRSPALVVQRGATPQVDEPKAEAFYYCRDSNRLKNER